MIAIIDYGLGNLGSIANMLEVVGADSIITDDPHDLMTADKLILPGVGAFDAGMSLLAEKRLIKPIIDETARGKPLLGICLGMQLLGRKSEEGILPGLSLIPFDNIKFRKTKGSNLKIPHMGWDLVSFTQNNPLTDNLTGEQRYYFVHSYNAVCDNPANELMSCNYGCSFSAAVFKDNVYGVQFHPEKSHDFGMALLKNFVEKC